MLPPTPLNHDALRARCQRGAKQSNHLALQLHIAFIFESSSTTSGGGGHAAGCAAASGHTRASNRSDIPGGMKRVRGIDVAVAVPGLLGDVEALRHHQVQWSLARVIAT